MLNRDFIEQFANLKFWRFDAVELANKMEAMMRLGGADAYFERDVVADARQSRNADGLYEIHLYDSDVIKFFKSFINFVRAVKGVHPDVVKSYINHLLSSSYYTDSALRDTLHLAFKHRADFDKLLTHFLPFKFYLSQVTDLVWQLPVLNEQSPVTAKLKEIQQSLSTAFKSSNTGKGVSVIQAELKKRIRKHDDSFKMSTFPSLQDLNLAGIDVCLQTLTEITRNLNEDQQQICRRVHQAITEIRVLLVAINKLKNEYPDATKWLDIPEKRREEYIELYTQLNTKLQVSNDDFAALQALAHHMPELTKIFDADSKLVTIQLAKLQAWNDSSVCADITELSEAVQRYDIFKNTAFPQLPTVHLQGILNGYGLRGHLQALVELTRIMNAGHEQYYDKHTDSYHFSVTTTIPNRNLMNAYNACSAAHTAMIEAHALLAAIERFKAKYPQATKWQDIPEDKRNQYIERHLKLNEKLQAINTHVAELQPLIKEIPALAEIFKADEKLITDQIADLKAWEKSDACVEINALTSSFHADDAFVWLRGYIAGKLSRQDKALYHDKKRDLYHIGDVSDYKRNVMLSYNINTRLKNAYALINKFRTEGFALGDISAATNLLYEIGFIVKEFRQLKNNRGLIAQIKEQLEIDLDLLLKEFASLFNQLIALTQKIEAQQGLKNHILIAKLGYVYLGYLELCDLNETKVPEEYRLRFDRTLFEAYHLQEIQDKVVREVEAEQVVQVKTAVQIKQYLSFHTHRINAGAYDLIDLLQIMHQLKTMPGHHAKVYHDYLQDLVYQLVGLDQLEKLIINEEEAIKPIIIDDLNNLKVHVKNENIQKRLDTLRELYLYKAQILDSLETVVANKDSSEGLANYPVKHFYQRGYSERFTNHIWTYFHYDPTDIHCVEEGVRSDITLAVIGHELPKRHAEFMAAMNKFIDHADPVVAEAAPYPNGNQQEPSDRNVAEITKLNSNDVAMLQHVAKSRKGFAILKLEQLRSLLLHYSSKLIHQDHAKALKDKRTVNGVYPIEPNDTIAIVNIKTLHNSVVRVEGILELLNRLSDIPTYTKFEKAKAIFLMMPIFKELKERLKAFFGEMMTLTEAATALGQSMYSTTMQALIKEILIQSIDTLEMIQGMTDLYNYNFDNPENKTSSAESKENPSEEEITLKSVIEKLKKWSQDDKKEPDTNIANTDEKIAAAVLDAKTGGLKKEVIESLELFIKTLGVTLPTNPNGSYDVSALEDKSPQKIVAVLLNNSRKAAKDSENNQPATQSTTQSTTKNTTKNIIAKFTELLPEEFGDAMKLLGTAYRINRIMAANNQAAEFKSKDKDAEERSQMMIAMQLYIETAGPVKHVNHFADGSYDTRSLEDGSLQKCLAAFSNISDDIYKFMNSTVELADGHHIIGFVKSISDLVTIKQEIELSKLQEIFNDGFVQYRYDAKQFSKKMDELIVKALNFIQPKIVEGVAHARITETLLGTKENMFVGMVEWALDTFIYLGKMFADDKFSQVKKGFPYDAKTLELAQSERLRLKKLNITGQSHHHFLKNGIASLKLMIRDLSKRTGIPTSIPMDDTATTMTQTESPALADDFVMMQDDTVDVDISLQELESDDTTLPALSAEQIRDLEDKHLSVMPDELEEDEASEYVRAYQEDEREFRVLLKDQRIMQQQTDDAIRAEREAKIEKAATTKVNTLSAACVTYKHHLRSEIKRLLIKVTKNPIVAHIDLEKSYPQIQSRATDENTTLLKLTIDKFNAIHDMQQTLAAKTSSVIKLSAFQATITPARKQLLETRRDAKGITFLKVLATIFTFGIAAACGLWSSRGERLIESADKVLKSPSPSL